MPDSEDDTTHANTWAPAASSRVIQWPRIEPSVEDFKRQVSKKLAEVRKQGSTQATTKSKRRGFEQEIVAGVDGAKGGWVMAVTDGQHLEFSMWRSFRDLWADASHRGIVVVAVDIPIGLADKNRTADLCARMIMKVRQREATVFWAPPQCVLQYAQQVANPNVAIQNIHNQATQTAKAHTGKGISRQALQLLPKIREVRSALNAQTSFGVGSSPRAAEVHPEVSFAMLKNSEEPEALRDEKRSTPGICERLRLIQSWINCTGIHFRPAATSANTQVYPHTDDLLDAAAAAWTAWRIHKGEAICLGGGELDQTGYPMEIWV